MRVPAMSVALGVNGDSGQEAKGVGLNSSRQECD